MQAANKRIALTPSAGGVFDNEVVELIRHDGALKFLVCKGSSHKTAGQFTHAGVVHCPPRIDPSVCNLLALPSGPADFGSTRRLFDRVSELFSRAIPGNETLSVPLSFEVLSSWLSDFAPVAPFVWVAALATCTTSTLKQLLGRLCRHGFVLNLLSAGWLSSVPMVLQPTVIADVDLPSRRVLSELGASQTHGAHLIRRGQAIDPFCAKVIFARRPLQDCEAAGFPLQMVLPPDCAPTFDLRSAAHLIEELQNQLLGYRLANYSKIAPPSFDLGQVSAPVRALAHVFAGSVVGDDDLQARIVPYLQQLQSDIQADPITADKRLILEALRTRWTQHEVGDTEIAGDVNTLIRGRGGSRELSPEMVGWRLRAMSIPTTDISGGLRGLKMAEARAAILKAGVAYGLTLPEVMPETETKRGIQERDERFGGLEDFS